MRKNKRCTAKRGFTLVELLVVIAIITVLISILLPALNKATASARNVQCLSNLHQMGVMLDMYANDYKGYVPLGYEQGQAWATYVIVDVAGFKTQFGVIYKLGYGGTSNGTPPPRVMYCPSQTNPTLSFNTPTNPWPPVFGFSSTRASYSMRPVCNWANPTVNNDFSIPAANAKPIRLSAMSTASGAQAMISDVVGWPNSPFSSAQATTVHGKGINVLYADRSARFAPLGATTDLANWAHYQNIVASTGTGTGLSTFQALWTAGLDANR